MPEPFLPAEIWSRIFEFSCRDNGYTGQSLSLTSRAFNALSARYKFQSISLQNMKYTLRFFDVLRSIPPNLRRVRYLFIAYDGLWRSTYGKQSNWETGSYYESASESDDMEDLDDLKLRAQVDGDMDYSPPDDSAWAGADDDDTEEDPLSEVEISEVEEDKDAIKLPEEEIPLPDHPVQGCLIPFDDGEGGEYFDRVFVKTLYEILHTCADTLFILSVRVQAITFNSFPFLPGIPMPRLQELTWAVSLARGPVVVDPPFVRPPPPNQVRFPELFLLHIPGGIIPTTGQIIETHCPKMLYLRTGLVASYFQEELDQKAEIPLGPDGRPPSYISAATPSSVIQHLLDVDWDRNAVDTAWLLNHYGLNNQTLRELVDPRVKFCTFYDKPWDVMETDWQDRILGKVGGWDWEECVFDGLEYDE